MSVYDEINKLKYTCQSLGIDTSCYNYGRGITSLPIDIVICHVSLATQQLERGDTPSEEQVEAAYDLLGLVNMEIEYQGEDLSQCPTRSNLPPHVTLQQLHSLAASLGQFLEGTCSAEGATSLRTQLLQISSVPIQRWDI